MLPAQPIQGLIDGLACLQAVISAGGSVGSREVGRRCELNRTRANRLLGTWRHLGLLDQDREAKYQPGPALHILAGMSLHASGLLRSCLPHAQDWWHGGHAVSLAVRWQDRLAFLLHARPGKPFVDGIGHQATGLAVRSSAGLAMLATAADAELAGWDCAQQWREHGDGGELEQRLAQVRASGFATRIYADGTRSVGVAIGDSGQAALAVSRPGLTVREAARVATSLHSQVQAINEAMHDDTLPPIDDRAISA